MILVLSFRNVKLCKRQGAACKICGMIDKHCQTLLSSRNTDMIDGNITLLIFKLDSSLKLLDFQIFQILYFYENMTELIRYSIFLQRNFGFRVGNFL